MGICDKNGLPVALWTESASPHEARLVEQTLDSRFLPEAPQIVVGDKAYDSDPLDEKLLEEHGVILCAPHRRGRKAPATQDGRQLRRYKRRWLIERLWAWMQNYRRITTRWDWHLENYTGWVQLGAIIILLRRLT